MIIIINDDKIVRSLLHVQLNLWFSAIFIIMRARAERYDVSLRQMTSRTIARDLPRELPKRMASCTSMMAL